MEKRRTTKSYLKNSHSTTEMIVDRDTGEILSTNTKKHTYIANDKEEFMLLYINTLPIFWGMTSACKSVYTYLLYSYNMDVVYEIGGGMRKVIADKLGICNSSVANALTELKNAEFIFQHGKGVYQTNPRYAYKGSTKNRAEAMKAIIEIIYKDDKK